MKGDFIMQSCGEAEIQRPRLAVKTALEKGRVLEDECYLRCSRGWAGDFIGGRDGAG